MLDDKCYGEKYSRERVCVDMGSDQKSILAFTLSELGNHCRALSTRASQSDSHFNCIALSAVRILKRGKDMGHMAAPVSTACNS